MNADATVQNKNGFKNDTRDIATTIASGNDCEIPSPENTLRNIAHSNLPIRATKIAFRE
jgi:hypothetical protein